jgi:2,5-diketo-D-gluconate reductase B
MGFGTYQNTGDAVVQSVVDALDVGYRHIDTAQYYENEAAIGEGLDRSPVNRDEVFLATKIWPDRLAHDEVLAAARESRDRLGVDTIDLLYVHWPAREYDPESTLSAFERLREDGVIRQIGVSNFTPDLFEEARSVTDAPIVANQVEMHPLLYQLELLSYLQNIDVTLVAFSPLCRGEVFDVPEITAVAEKHEVSPTQVSLAWLLSKDNVAVIPKATSRLHIEDNYRALDLDLDAEDIERIDSIDRHVRNSDPEWGPDW